MKIIVVGKKFEQIHDPAEDDFAETMRRVMLTVEIWNRDRPQNQRQVKTAEVWPLPKS